MPGEVFRPEGFGPRAIAGERLMAAARPRELWRRTIKLSFRTSVGRERQFEPVNPASTIRRPEVIATRPTRSADEAVGVTVDTACFSAWSSAFLGLAAVWPPAQ
jgi:hypothetical protein